MRSCNNSGIEECWMSDLFPRWLRSWRDVKVQPQTLMEHNSTHSHCVCLCCAGGTTTLCSKTVPKAKTHANREVLSTTHYDRSSTKSSWRSMSSKLCSACVTAAVGWAHEMEVWFSRRNSFVFAMKQKPFLSGKNCSWKWHRSYVFVFEQENLLCVYNWLPWGQKEATFHHAPLCENDVHSCFGVMFLFLRTWTVSVLGIMHVTSCFMQLCFCMHQHRV